MGRKTPLIILTGPTGAGKTALALKLAKKHPIEVVSADSMQVYRYMDIGTAKPGNEELKLLPHHVIDVVNPDQEFNAGMFLEMALHAIKDIQSRLKIPVVIGGTGLYIKALIYGLCNAPPRSERLRYVLNSIIKQKGIHHLYNVLKRLDPQYAQKIGPNDRSRIVRALEMTFLTGSRPSSIHNEHGFSKPIFNTRIACIMPSREKLYERINLRVTEMMDMGLVEETVSILDMGYSPDLKALKNLAYKHIVSDIHSEISSDTAIRLIQRDTRHFAKRQITWFKGNLSENTFLDRRTAEKIMDAWLSETECTP